MHSCLAVLYSVYGKPPTPQDLKTHDKCNVYRAIAVNIGISDRDSQSE
jgi:hypothetical protein